jgi:Fe-Mn family superoxide dismutase
MEYEIKTFDYLLGIAGLSDSLLKNHFTLYQGYVANFNKLNDILMGMEKRGEFGTPDYAELNRRFGWEFNGMRLHEYYFGNLSKQEKNLNESSELSGVIKKEFGSIDDFKKDFKAMAAMRGIGWIVLYFDKQTGRIFNVWINEHDAGHFAGCVPILVMDVFEHAYMLDYGIKKADYIEVFFEIIDWEVAEKRLKENL